MNGCVEKRERALEYVVKKQKKEFVVGARVFAYFPFFPPCRLLYIPFGGPMQRFFGLSKDKGDGSHKDSRVSFHGTTIDLT